MKKFDTEHFGALMNEMGRIYARFIKALKSSESPIAPNDHVVGPIGEWRAVETLTQMGLSAKKASDSAKCPDDLVVLLPGNRTEYISVKTTTEHSAGGLSGIFHCKGKWKWLIVIRLNRELGLREFFWIPRNIAKRLFTTKDNRPKQFDWNIACRERDKKHCPKWLPGNNLK